MIVIGLGRFGTSMARTLETLGSEVLGVDARPDRVADLRDELTHVAEADTTDVRALEQLGAADFDRAVVAIGGAMESSILTTAALVDLGIGDIWAKAMTEQHARILELVGAHHVVFPEAQMGERVAHLVAGRMLDFLPLDAGFALVEATAPESMTGRTLGEIGVRAKYGVTVVCVKPVGGRFTYATPDTVLGPGDLIVVAGETDDAEAFAALD
ncbi:MAG TPA: TrkA family potassium uptake protein [Acidimicrobiales bacterium]|nr:TrkA family potassium uptake protein [Acidimicrobiales bacterium]